MTLLAGAPARQVSFARLFGAMSAVCCACGTHEVSPDLCRECPLPKFVTLLTMAPGALREAKAVAGARE